ncbi:MAG: response regulator transcription factor [Bacteroidota bacterium]
MRIWLVEDEPRFQSAFALLVEGASDLQLERTFDDFSPIREALDEGYAGPFPHLIVLDIRLPGESGIAAARQLRAAAPDTEILMLTTEDDPATFFEALRSGATGYVVKGGSPAQLLRSIRQTAEGVADYSPGVARHISTYFAAPRPSPLTERETEVLHALARGLSKRAIAEELCLSPHTVDSHMRHIYEKLQVSSGVRAVLKAVRMGLIDPDTLDDDD